MKGEGVHAQQIGRDRSDWSHLAQGRHRWRAVVTTAMNF